MPVRNVILKPRYEAKDLPSDVGNVWPVREERDRPTPRNSVFVGCGNRITKTASHCGTASGRFLAELRMTCGEGRTE
jgi:hypothetical protein